MKRALLLTIALIGALLLAWPQGVHSLVSSIACSQLPAHTGDVTTSAGSCATTIAANAVTNAKAAQMAAHTFKANNTGSTANSADISIADMLGELIPTYRGGFSAAVNLNAAAPVDTAIAITLPTGHTKYRLLHVMVSNNGTTGSLTTARAGLFTSTGGGGIALCADQALSAITSSTDDVASNALQLTCTIANTRITSSTLQFRLGTAQGAAATADVSIYIQPLN